MRYPNVMLVRQEAYREPLLRFFDFFFLHHMCGTFFFSNKCAVGYFVSSNTSRVQSARAHFFSATHPRAHTHTHTQTLDVVLATDTPGLTHTDFSHTLIFFCCNTPPRAFLSLSLFVLQTTPAHIHSFSHCFLQHECAHVFPYCKILARCTLFLFCNTHGTHGPGALFFSTHVSFLQHTHSCTHTFPFSANTHASALFQFSTTPAHNRAFFWFVITALRTSLYTLSHSKISRCTHARLILFVFVAAMFCLFLSEHTRTRTRTQKKFHDRHVS